MCLLFAKSGIELLLLTINGDNQFWRWEAWLLVLGLVVCALLQLWYLHKALILADPTLVCPCESLTPYLDDANPAGAAAFCLYNVSSIVNGLVYFDQFSLITSLHLGLVSVGIAVLLAGVWVVSIHSEPPPADTSDEEDTESELLPGPLPIRREPSAASSIPQAGSSASPPRERRATSYTYNRYSTTSNIHLMTDGGTLGTGFQIGLSPLSPGVEIVPRKRRVLEEQGSDVVGRRRALSEGSSVVPEAGGWRRWWRRRRR